MTIASRIGPSFRDWWRKTFPASRAVSHSHHEFLALRLAQLENLIAKQLVATGAPAAVQNEVLAILRLLQPQRVEGYKKIRVGRSGDGGYVQIDDLEGISHALSFGISDDDSWDLAMANAGIAVEQFDHSIAAAPSTHPLLNFHRKMVAPESGTGSVSLPAAASIYSNRDADLILKMDVEGCEWDIFDQADEATLDKFAQIICEFHDLSHLAQDAFRARARRVFEKLASRFAPVHLHGNNCGKIYIVANVALPDILEISFVSRARYSFNDSDERFPTPLDAPNNPALPEIVLGAFRY